MYRAEGITFAMLIEAVYLKRGLKYHPGLGHRLCYSGFFGLYSGSPVPTAAIEARNWFDMNDDKEKRVLDLSETFIDLVGIALPSAEDLQQLKPVEEEHVKQTGLDVMEEDASEEGNAITHFELTVEED